MAGCLAARNGRMLGSRRSGGSYILGDIGCHVEDLGFLESRVLGWGALRSDLGLKIFPTAPWRLKGRGMGLELMESVGSH